MCHHRISQFHWTTSRCCGQEKVRRKYLRCVAALSCLLRISCVVAMWVYSGLHEAQAFRFIGAQNTILFPLLVCPSCDEFAYITVIGNYLISYSITQSYGMLRLFSCRGVLHICGTGALMSLFRWLQDFRLCDTALSHSSRRFGIDKVMQNTPVCLGVHQVDVFCDSKRVFLMS